MCLVFAICVTLSVAVVAFEALFGSGYVVRTTVGVLVPMSSSCTAQDYRRHFLSSANGRDVWRLAQMGPAKHTAVFRCLPSSPHNSSNVKPRPSPFVPQRSPVWFQPSGQSLQDRMLFEVCRYVHPDSWKISQGCWAMTLSSLSRVVPNPKGQKYCLTSEFLCSVFSPPRGEPHQV